MTPAVNARTTSLLLLALMILAGCAHDNPNEPATSNYVQGVHFDVILFDGLSPSVIPPISDELEANYERTTGHNEGSTWSPDGKRLAFNSTRSGNFDIWLMDADTE